MIMIRNKNNKNNQKIYQFKQSLTKKYTKYTHK
jgi:hypothetical protein